MRKFRKRVGFVFTSEHQNAGKMTYNI